MSPRKIPLERGRNAAVDFASDEDI
jgi:hypothetical protein